MGKPTGFKEIARETPKRKPVELRILEASGDATLLQAPHELDAPCHFVVGNVRVPAFARRQRRIALVGASRDGNHFSRHVLRELVRRGYDVVPVPVYYPEVTEILGKKVYRKVADIPGPVGPDDRIRYAIAYNNVGAAPASTSAGIVG